MCRLMGATGVSEGDEPITFLASFPNIQTAIRVAGDGGARILLDIPESEMPSIVRLMLMRGIVLKVTVEPEKVQRPGAPSVRTWKQGKR
jgi:hypothetical protein